MRELAESSTMTSAAGMAGLLSTSCSVTSDRASATVPACQDHHAAFSNGVGHAVANAFHLFNPAAGGEFRRDDEDLDAVLDHAVNRSLGDEVTGTHFPWRR